MSRRARRALVALLIVSTVAFLLWRYHGKDDPNHGLASGNGRIEAAEIDIAAKNGGRVERILVREGDFVTTGQLVARMETEALQAQLRQAEAQLQEAESRVATARSQVLLRQAEKAAAEAVLAQRQAEHEIARKRQERSSALAAEGATSQQEADEHVAQLKGATAAIAAVRAQIAAADAAVIAARTQVTSAQSAVDAVEATIERIQVEIADAALRAPRDGRIQYRIAQPGEVVAPGGRVLNMIDLNDVFMTFFLPTAVAGRVAMGSEVRLVLDAAPQYVIPANVSFVADVAQFTPKTVETTEERVKLMFRVRAQIPPALLQKYVVQVKTGLPGMAYVRLDPAVPWPEHLQVKLPR